jgi:hypothetical protein
MLVSINVTDTASISDEARATVRTRTNLSVLHLLSAATHSQRVSALEQEHAGDEFGEFWEEILASASAGVFSSVAALEAYANELFVDHRTVFPDFPEQVMAKLWELYEQKPILEKFQFALLLKSAEQFDSGLPLFQNAAALIKLRNGLTHFKPEWRDEQSEHRKISGALAGRFTPSPFFPTDEPLFPRAWTSQSCIEWSLTSVMNLVLEFERRITLPSRFAPFQERLRRLV